MKTFVYITLALILSACSSPHIKDYDNTTPKLILNEFFNGELLAHGVVLDMNGKLTRRFSATISASWADTQGTLDEKFIYDDGEKQTRIWTLQDLGNGKYQGTAGDVIGIATGQTAGSAFYWKYDLEIKVDGEPIVVTLDDWMYLIDTNNLINRSKIIKYGLEVGEVILNIRKL